MTDTERSRRRSYRIADNFLSFYLGVLSRYRAEIDRGLGPSILPVLVESLDDALGSPYEAAFRNHLRGMAVSGALGPEPVVALGPFWTDDGQNEIDAVALAGRARRPVLVGEAKWTRSVDGARLAAVLSQKARALPGGRHDGLRRVVCARSEVRSAPDDVLALTAVDLFPDP